MKLIKPEYRFINQEFGESPKEIIANMYRHIEVCGKVCYKSERTIGEDTARTFYDRLVKSGHTSVLEHAAVYLVADKAEPCGNVLTSTSMLMDEYSDVRYNRNLIFMSTNMRVIYNAYKDYEEVFEMNGFGNIEEFLESCISKPSFLHSLRHTVLFTSDIHFYKDCTRHRRMSFSIESTRFCNYSKDKFGNEITFIKPSWLSDEDCDEFVNDCEFMNRLYLKWIDRGWKPQEAAFFLCQGTKADAVISGFDKDWKHFFDLRALGKTGEPHPTVKELAKPLYEEFKKRGYIQGDED